MSERIEMKIYWSLLLFLLRHGFLHEPGSRYRTAETTTGCPCPFKNAKMIKSCSFIIKGAVSEVTFELFWGTSQHYHVAAGGVTPSYISKSRTVLQAMIAWESGVRLIMIPAPLILLRQPGLDPLKCGMCLINHLVPMSGQWAFSHCSSPDEWRGLFSKCGEMVKKGDSINSLFTLSFLFSPFLLSDE